MTRTVTSLLPSPVPDAEVQPNSELDEFVKLVRQGIKHQFIFNILCKTVLVSIMESRHVPVAVRGLRPEVDGEVTDCLPCLMEKRSPVATETDVPSPKTLRSSSEKAWNEAQAGVLLSHSAVPQSRALPVRMLITNATLVSLGVNM